MNWGHYITFTLIGFALVIFSLVTISMKQDVSLVASDYYKQEIAYQDQIDKISNFNQLSEKPEFKLNTSNVVMEVSFPDHLVSKMTNGTIQLYRPSESQVDKLIDIKLGQSGEQKIPMNTLKKGLWKAKINFEIEGKSFYHEKNVIL